MRRKLQQCLVAVAVLCGVTSAHAFALLGPIGAHPWQTPAIGYDWGGFDIGNPMNLGEEYRWNVPELTYGFDSSFLNYFGLQGVEAVEEAIQVFNDLPRASDINLNDYPTENRRNNDLAAALGIRDLKSTVMVTLLELMGLAEPERWTWALRDRDVRTIGGQTITNYLVLQRNFDPVTLQPTNRVNDVIYTYEVQEFEDPDFADAIEIFGQLDFPFSSVASGRGGGPSLFETGLLPGQLYPGLTRDDVGGWRYLLRRPNYNVEQLPTNTFLVPGFFPTAAGGGGTVPWLPAVIGTNQIAPTLPPGVGPFTPWVGLTNIATNVFGTNIFTNLPPIDIALRPGVEKIRFRRVRFDSLLGQVFPPFTNVYTDTVISNFSRVTQRVQRVVTEPDLVFGAADLGLTTDPNFPVILSRGVVQVNNDAINGITVQGGPGVLRPPVRIIFSDILPVFFNTGGSPTGPPIIDPNDPFARFLILGFRSIVWGSFVEGNVPPIIYPNSISLEQLEEEVERRRR